MRWEAKGIFLQLRERKETEHVTLERNDLRLVRGSLLGGAVVEFGLTLGRVWV